MKVAETKRRPGSILANSWRKLINDTPKMSKNFSLGTQYYWVQYLSPTNIYKYIGENIYKYLSLVNDPPKLQGKYLN